MIASSGESQPTGGRWLAALILLGAAGFLLRWAAQSPVVYNWDSVHYVLALDRYDIRAHQPHPPGSYYYILLARAARGVTGDPHRALLLVSALSGALFVPVMFSLGRLLGGTGSGMAAAVVAVTAPLFWFYGSVGLNYGPAGVLSTAAALGFVQMCRPASRRRGDGPLLAGAALGLLGGFRPTDVIFLMPAAVWAAWRWLRARPSGTGGSWDLVRGLAVAGLLTAGWLLPNMASAGGPAGYLESLRGQEHLLERSSALASGWPALNEALITHRRSLESMLGAGWFWTAAAGVAWVLRRRRGARPETPAEPRASRAGSGMGVLAALIVAPAFFFYLLGHFNSPGYTLTYAGFLTAALAAGSVRLLQAGASASRFSAWDIRTALVATLTVAANGALFVRGWPGWGALGQRSLSYAEIRDHADYYRELDAFLRTRYAPGEVRLLASWNSTDGLRVVQFLLPRYSADVAQAVSHRPRLPASLGSLSFLRLITPEELEREGRPTFAVLRTREDPAYHQSLFPEEKEQVNLGDGHVVLRVHEPRGDAE